MLEGLIVACKSVRDLPERKKNMQNCMQSCKQIRHWWIVANGKDHVYTDLADVGRDEISDELFHVVVDGAPFLDRSDDRREVVISKHHLRGWLGDRRARTHRNADLGLLQSRSIIHPVACLQRDHRIPCKDKRYCQD